VDPFLLGRSTHLLSRLLRQITCPHPRRLSLSRRNIAYMYIVSSLCTRQPVPATERGHEPHQDPPTNVADPSLHSGGRRHAVAGAAVAGQPRGRSKLQSFSFFASGSSESPRRRLQPLQGRQEVLAHRFQPAAQLMIVRSGVYGSKI
jgi:hypothetical protein